MSDSKAFRSLPAADPDLPFEPTAERALPLTGFGPHRAVSGLALRFRPDWPSDPPNVYIVGDTTGWALIDTGWGRPDDLADLEAWLSRADGPSSQPPICMALTHGHPDHSGGASYLHRLWPDVPILAAPAETEVLTRNAPGLPWSIAPERAVPVGSTGSLLAVPAAGHTLGSLAWVWQPAPPVGPHPHPERSPIVFAGDTVLGRLSSWIGPPDGDLDLYLETLARLAECYPIATLAPGHGPVRSGFAAQARALRDRRLARDTEILARMPHAPTARQLAQALYAGRVPDSTLSPGGMAERTVLGHLIHLGRQGLVHVTVDKTGTHGTDPMTQPYGVGPA